MPTVDMVMPKMGESVQEGTVIAWKVAVGDMVEKDQILLDIATDKVDTEVPSPAAGKITEILVSADETVPVGAVIAKIASGADAESGGSAPAKPAPAKSETKAAAPKAAAKPKAEKKPAGGGGAAFDMVMPKMGESVQEGTVIAWKVKVGDAVEKDQILLDIATDKVDTEVPSPASGVILEILAKADETVPVGAVIARIGAEGAVADDSEPEPSDDAGEEPEDDAVESEGAQSSPSGETTTIPRRDGKRFYSPLVRRIAGEQGVTLEELRGISGSGQGGRVTKADLLGYLKSGRKAAAKPAAKAAPAAEAKAAPAGKAAPVQKPGLGEKKTLEELGLDPNRVTVQKLNFMRKKIAQHMRDSLDTSAHVFSVHEIDMTTCWEIREAVKKDFKEQFGTSLTFTSFIVWAAARALRQFPWVNARLNGDEVIFHDYVNIGVAVALPENGLVVPKIRNAEDLTIAGIQRKMNDLATRARDNKLSPDELSGGTFTITNMGSGGTLIGLPIISQPEVAIMGVGAIQQRPVIKNGGIIPRHMMYVSLSYDHRLVDGMLAANFLSAVTAELEGLNPVLIGLDRRKG